MNCNPISLGCQYVPTPAFILADENARRGSPTAHNFRKFEKITGRRAPEPGRQFGYRRLPKKRGEIVQGNFTGRREDTKEHEEGE